MENVSEQFKKEHAAAERGDSPMTWMVKGVNLLNALRLKGPFDGEQIRSMIEQAEKRGLAIPCTPMKKMTAAEVRSFTAAVEAQRKHMVIPGTVPEARKAATIDENEELRVKERIQRQRFELMLEEEGITPEQLDRMIAEKNDPLMILVNNRNPKRK